MCMCAQVRADLHGYREVSLGLGRKEHVDCFLLEGLVTRCWSAHLNNVQLMECRREGGREVCQTLTTL